MLQELKPPTLMATLVVLIIIAGIVGFLAGQMSVPPGGLTTVTLTTTQTVTSYVTASPTPTTTPGFIGTVKIGALLPLNLPIGQMMLNSIQMAVEEINAEGGVLGYKIEVVTYDTEWSGDKANAGYKYLAEQGVKVVVGVFGSHEALAIMDLLQLYEVPIIASGAVSDAIDAMVLQNYDAYKYWF
ncbi:MAG: ABC transporter substrate-binding protein, partial [Zestosphaera sp.]